MRTINTFGFIKLYEVYEEELNVYLVLEYVKGPTLFETNQMRLQFKEHEIRHTFNMLVEALDHVHFKKIVLRDLNSNSINLREKGKPGFANKPLIVNFEDCYREDDHEYLSLRIGTIGYIAPEVLQLKFDSHTTDFYKADIFSLGVVIY